MFIIGLLIYGDFDFEWMFAAMLNFDKVPFVKAESLSVSCKI